MTSDALIELVKFVEKENPSEVEKKSFSSFLKDWSGTFAMFNQATQHEEVRKEALGIAYDEVFKKLAKSDAKTTDAITDSRFKTEGHERLEHLDLARDKPASWVEKAEVAQRLRASSKINTLSH